jgi:kynurenine formamidase
MTDLTLITIDLSVRGGIVARGILLDFVRYAKQKGITYDVTTSYPISLAQLKEIVQEEGLTIRQGDVLIVRSGLSKWVKSSTPDSVGPFKENTHFGVDPTPDLLEWIWDNNFSAMGGDAIAFETVPASDGSCMLPQVQINHRH